MEFSEGSLIRRLQPLFIINAHDEKSLAEGVAHLERAVRIGEDEHEPLPLFYGLVS